MIKIEIDGNLIKNMTAKGSTAKIAIEFITAFYATFGAIANDAEKYNSFRDMVVGGIRLADYDEVKESMIENE